MTTHARASLALAVAFAAALAAGAGACVREHAEISSPTGSAGAGGGAGAGAGGRATTGTGGAITGATGGSLGTGGQLASTGGANAGAGGANAGGAGAGAGAGGANAGGGGGTPASLIITPQISTWTTFGTIAIGSFVEASFVVTNHGGSPSGVLHIDELADPFSVVAAPNGACRDGETLLLPEDHCTVRVHFAPAVSGGANAMLAVHAAPGGDAGFPIAGRAPGFRALAAGTNHTCAVLDAGAVSCWGSNDRGQSGIGSSMMALAPMTVKNLPDATGIAAGRGHTCALLVTGTVACWGANDSGQLGNGTTADSPTPVNVMNVAGARAVVAGERHTCALLATGGVSCWGAAEAVGDGQPTDPMRFAVSVPVSVANIANAESIAAGGRHTCARLAGGAVACWGVNQSGEIGSGAVDPTEPAMSPVAVVNVAGAAGVAAGHQHSCAWLGDTTARCWGNNFEGELGTGAVSMMEARPVAVMLTNVVALSTGDYHSCAVVAGGHVLCWGSNMLGQTGQVMGVDHSPMPALVSGIDNAALVAAGGWHTCAQRATGRISCWGSGAFGQLGDNKMHDSVSPVDVLLMP